MASPYVKAALVTAAAALLGLFFVSQLDAMRASEIRSSVEDLLFQSESERLLFSYATLYGNSTAELCASVKSATASRATQTLTLYEKIRYYENSNVVSAEYDRLRNQYYLANAALYLNVMTAEKYCGRAPYKTVLFFYRITPDCPECRAQGGVLDSVVNRHPDVRVFAFPTDSGLEFVDFLAERHGVTQVPSIVAGDSAAVGGVLDERGVEQLLEKV